MSLSGGRYLEAESYTHREGARRGTEAAASEGRLQPAGEHQQLERDMQDPSLERPEQVPTS